MFFIYHIREKEDSRSKTWKQVKRIIFMQKMNDGLSKEQTLGITGPESCLSYTKRRLRNILDWCNSHAVSLSIER
ncbi:MAG: hypothetical protein ACTHKK_10180 [Candidatus Nitrosocosmicus sp.]